jgi:hypothetical protein
MPGELCLHSSDAEINRDGYIFKSTNEVRWTKGEKIIARKDSGQARMTQISRVKGDRYIF